MSATYRQDSRMTTELVEKDQANRWLGRGPRTRLSSEQVRDQALSVSGLLSNKVYGRSVMPFQPDGVWQTVYSGEAWKTSEDEDQHRRGVYTFMKRTSPYPTMITFDGSSREVCTVRRIRTNTPLQALVTLNDPVYVEASRSFAKRMMKAGTSPELQIKAGYRLALLRDISDEKLTILNGLYTEALKEYQPNKEAAKKLTGDANATPQLAAITIVASAMLNLDEFITKE